ncbi:hypothetical protein [Actinacidiphila rubida]|uniref:Uncharacterized protein n=2 Tax=Actinacidiphila rubida TaxID=310780 RepID=A0A1H8TRZ4_9ACTN|nr:hypothetical protein [Actinacidiphila rubida]SEO93208.1 hypothetical protein SAMN05216267_10574 [Actinacidiphila rubida]
MRERGDLRPDADPVAPTHLLAAAFQEGMLLEQAADDTTPLGDAMNGVLDYIASFATHSC